MRKSLNFILLLVLVAASSAQFAPRRPMYAGCTATALNTLGTLGVWYKMDAQTVVADGTALSTITDSSGNARDASGTTTTRPVYKTSILNGKPSVRPDGVDDKMTISGDLSFLQGNSFTVIAVVKITTNKTNNHFLGGSTATTNSELRLGWVDTTHLFLGQYANDLTSSATSSAGAGDILTFDRNASGRQIWQGTTSRGTDSDTNQMAGTFTGSLLFRSDLTGVTFDGDVLEIAIYSPAISSGNITSAQNSLKCKYGL